MSNTSRPARDTNWAQWLVPDSIDLFVTFICPGGGCRHLVQQKCSFSFTAFGAVASWESWPGIKQWGHRSAPLEYKWWLSDFEFLNHSYAFTVLTLALHPWKTMPLHMHLPKYHSESIRRSCDFICQGQDFDICNIWFILLLMETGRVKCTTSGHVTKHTHTGATWLLWAQEYIYASAQRRHKMYSKTWDLYVWKRWYTQNCRGCQIAQHANFYVMLL